MIKFLDSKTRERMIDLLVIYEYETMDASCMQDILRDGCPGYGNMNDSEILESFECFEDHYTEHEDEYTELLAEGRAQKEINKVLTE